MTRKAQEELPEEASGHRTGVLILYTGSPDTPEAAPVAAYLREFLMDPYVLDMPGWLRTLLVKGIIAPVRSRKSAAKYRRIWMADGSPLAVYTHRFRQALEALLPEWPLAVGAAYGSETISNALASLAAHGIERLVVLPMFPQYAGATRGSLRARLHAALPPWFPGGIEILEVSPFYAHPTYIKVAAQCALPLLEPYAPDYVVFSYHGLPLRQAHIQPEDGSGAHYEQQCEITTSLLVRELRLKEGRYTQAYQSRFGRGWLTPATDTVLTDLAQSGKKRVALLAPSFVTDCLETLEELDMEARDTFIQAGGEAFLRIPALNDHQAWVQAAATLILDAAGKADTLPAK